MATSDQVGRAIRAVRRIAGDDHAAAELLEALGLIPYRHDPVSALALKQCTKCGQSQPVTNFYRERTASDGLCPHCKGCRANDQRARAARRTQKVSV